MTRQSGAYDLRFQTTVAIAMMRGVIAGSTLAEVGEAAGVGTQRASEMIRKAARMSLHVSRWPDRESIVSLHGLPPMGGVKDFRASPAFWLTRLDALEASLPPIP